MSGPGTGLHAWIDASACRELAGIVRTDARSLINPVITRPDGSVWSAGSKVNQRSGRVGKVRGPFVSARDKWLTGAVLALGVAAVVGGLGVLQLPALRRP